MKTNVIDREIPTYAFDTYVGSWSPDGRQFAFATRDGHCVDLYVVTFGGGEAIRRLTRDANVTGVPSWSLDGTALYFSSNFDVYVIGVDGTNLKHITENRPWKGFILESTARSVRGRKARCGVHSPRRSAHPA